MAILLLVVFLEVFNSIHRGKMEQIIRVYDLPKNRVMAILMLYKNTKAMVCSSDGDIDFLDIVAGVLQGVTLASYMFIICQDYILWTSIDLIKENGFTIKKAISRHYPVETDADNVGLLSNTLAQPESLEQTADSIDLYVNLNKSEFMCFKRERAIYTLSVSPLKLVDNFTHHSSNISFTESGVNISLAKV